MKKILFISSLVLMAAWIVGVFILKAPALIHVLLVLSLILYIRTLLVQSATEASYDSNK